MTPSRDLLRRWRRHSDARVWERRRHLDNPVPLQGDGALLKLRRWSLQLWPDDHEPDEASHDPD